MELIVFGFVFMYALSLIAQAVGGVASWLRERRAHGVRPGSTPATPQQLEPYRTTVPSTRSLAAPARRPSAHRPSPFGGSSKVKFGEPSSTFSLGQLDGLVDALSGAPLDPASGLYRCPHCQVFYNPHSVAVLRTQNGGLCVSCLRPGLVPIKVAARTLRPEPGRIAFSPAPNDHGAKTLRATRGAAPDGRVTEPRQAPLEAASAGRNAAFNSAQAWNSPAGRNAAPAVVTLANYKQLAGRVITFEGHVTKVLVSQRGKDYAVMFEDRSWVRGFKAMVFRRDVLRVGGRQLVLGLANKRIRVRGLLTNDPTFGYQIVVSERRMIELIEPTPPGSPPAPAPIEVLDEHEF